jgi:RND family efflux transporter MFP subunit
VGESNARRIVNIDDVKPSSPKGRKTRMMIGIAVMSVAVFAVAVALGTAGSGKKAVKGYVIAAVEKADFVKSTEASGTVVVPAEISVPSPQEGYASRVYAAEGDAVEKGQVLAALSVPDLVNNRKDLAAQLAVAKISLKSVENDYDYQIASKDTSIARLDAKIADAEKDVETKKALLALKSSRRSDYDAAAQALETLRQGREDAVSERANQVRQRAIAVEKQQSTIDQLEIELERTDEDIEAARVKSPIAGEVLSVASTIKVPGSLIAKGSTIMTVADRTGTYIDFDVGEQYVSALEVGDKLAATIGANTVTATITSIGRVASLASDGLTATVAVRAKPEAGSTLTPGASAVATIALGTKKDDLVLPRGAYLTTGSQKYVYKVEGKVARKVAVEFGEIQGNKVEVVKGLEAGDRIIVSGYGDFIDESVVELR